VGKILADSSFVTNASNPGFYRRHFGNKNPVNFYYRVDNAQIYETGERSKDTFSHARGTKK
jgi:hypothetical protein